MKKYFAKTKENIFMKVEEQVAVVLIFIRNLFNLTISWFSGCSITSDKGDNQSLQSVCTGALGILRIAELHR